MCGMGVALDSLMLRRALSIGLTILTLSSPVLAADGDADNPPVEAGKPSKSGKTWTAVTVGGIYVGLYGWLSLAWYDREDESDAFLLNDEGWFGSDTYAGGADKVGHAWINYTMVRGITGILTYGGWDHRASLMVSSLLSFGFFTISEVKDGYHKSYGFSSGDMVCNFLGNGLALALELSPELDRRFAFRVDYLPSSEFIDQVWERGPLNVPEDYTGQKFLLAYHLGSIDSLVKNPYFTWVEYVDLDLGFHASGYKPTPSVPTEREQTLFVGVSLDLQPLLGPKGTGGAGRRAMRFVTETYQVPYTTLQVGGLGRTLGPMPPAQSAP
jgi:hypothetical protein